MSHIISTLWTPTARYPLGFALGVACGGDGVITRMVICALGLFVASQIDRVIRRDGTGVTR